MIPSRYSKLAWLAAIALMVSAGAAVRLWAALDDFWLDELMSLSMALHAESAAEVFTRFRVDNNHHLTTLWMYGCGLQANWLLYRIPSLVSGIGTVLLAANIGRRWGALPSTVAAALTASSFVLITYASEARGYALAGFFALAGFLFLNRYLVTRSAWASAAFGLTSILGFLSHLTFVNFYVGALAWSLVTLRKDRRAAWQVAAELAKCHAAPLLFFACFYWFAVRDLRFGGGPVYALEDVLVDVLSLAVGGPEAEPYKIISALGAAGIGLVALVCLWRETVDLAVFFAVAIVIAPALLIVTQRPDYLLVRYFYLDILFFLLLLSYLAGRAYRAGWWGRAAAAALLALIVLGNAWHVADLLRVGRGSYFEAVRYMAEHSAGPSLRVASDDDFRNQLLLHYYSALLPNERQILYQSGGLATPKPFEWAITHSVEPGLKAPPTLSDFYGNPLELVRVYPHAGLSGMDWALYRKAEAAKGDTGH